MSGELHRWRAMHAPKKHTATASDDYAHMLGIDVAKRKLLSDPATDEALLNKCAAQFHTLSDVPRASDWIADAIISGKTIGISADYDADGNCSAAIFKRLLMECGVPPERITLHIPNRETEGYGINTDAVDALHRAGAGIIIALDNGTTAAEPLARAQSYGIPTVVIDHHGNHSSALLANDHCAIVNPNRSDEKPTPMQAYAKDLAAVGLSYFMAHEVLLRLQERGYQHAPPPEAYKNYIGLASIATIADVVNMANPLNHAMTRHGLNFINKNGDPRITHFAQIAKCSLPLASSDIAFTLAPIINAPGRLADSVAWHFLSGAHANLSGIGRIQDEIGTLDDSLTHILSTLTNGTAANIRRTVDTRRAGIAQTRQQNKDDVNTQLITYSMEINELRKAVQRAIVVQALPDARAQHEAGEPVIFISRPHWHEGVIGIAAGKVKEMFGKPTVVGAELEDGRIKLSARSIRVPDHPVEMVNIGGAFIALHAQKVMKKAGGHPMAAGGTIRSEQKEAFRTGLREVLGPSAKAGYDASYTPLHAVIDLRKAAITDEDSLKGFAQECLHMADTLAPFGENIRKPTFLLYPVSMQIERTTGAGSHLGGQLTALNGELMPRKDHYPVQLPFMAFHSGHGPLGAILRDSALMPCAVIGTFDTDMQGRVQFHIEDALSARNVRTLETQLTPITHGAGSGLERHITALQQTRTR